MSHADDYVDRIFDNMWYDDGLYHYGKRKKAKKMVNTNTVRVGDIVRKKYGSKHILVVQEFGNHFYGRYVDSNASTGRLHTNEVVHVNDTVEAKGKDGMKGKLFKILANDQYGIGLAVDSTGKYVLEMKDGSGILAFDKKEVELVMPFTFSVQFNGIGTEYSYLGKEGTVKVGDLLLKTDGTKGITIAKVTAVNTRSDKATKYFDGVKVVTEPLANE